MKFHLGIVALATAFVPAGATSASASRGTDTLLAEVTLAPSSASAVHTRCRRLLDHARNLQRKLEGAPLGQQAAAVLSNYDAIELVLAALEGENSVLVDAHPHEPIRNAAKACTESTATVRSDVLLSAPILLRLKGTDLSGANPAVQFIINRSIAAHERAGAGLPLAQRSVLGDLKSKLAALETQFLANINDARNSIKVRPDELAGLPDDYIGRHPPGEDGLVTITTDGPDLVPVLNYAHSEDVRRRLRIALETLAPENKPLLEQMLALRAQQAKLLSRSSFAELIIEPNMASSPQRVQQFLDDLATVSEAPAKRHASSLAQVLKAHPDSPALAVWNAAYARQLLRKEKYDLDPQEVRRFFAYDQVRDGLFQLASDLFGVEIRRSDTRVWHDSVEAFELRENGRAVGRFYLDNHPRAGKYPGARAGTVRTGLKNRIIPTVVMIANFPAGDHATGLMEHSEVETFLHEFGHLLHAMFSANRDYALQSNRNLEFDFGETPSTMLENWVWDYNTLKTFARDADGQKISEELVSKMNRARRLGKAFTLRPYLGQSAAALKFHSEPLTRDTSDLYREMFDRYSLVPLLPKVHPETSWEHLADYTANYYTYAWSDAIATDLLGEFERHGLRDQATARRYRELVLAPGASKPAKELVEDFLGREWSLAAFEQELKESD